MGNQESMETEIVNAGAAAAIVGGAADAEKVLSRVVRWLHQWTGVDLFLVALRQRIGGDPVTIGTGHLRRMARPQATTRHLAQERRRGTRATRATGHLGRWITDRPQARSRRMGAGTLARHRGPKVHHVSTSRLPNGGVQPRSARHHIRGRPSLPPEGRIGNHPQLLRVPSEVLQILPRGEQHPTKHLTAEQHRVLARMGTTGA